MILFLQQVNTTILFKMHDVFLFPWLKYVPFSLLRVELHLTNESPILNLKRSSACTNVSLLNLTDGEREDSTTENESTDDGGPPGGAGGESSYPLLPFKPAWSEDDDDTSSQQVRQRVTRQTAPS